MNNELVSFGVGVGAGVIGLYILIHALPVLILVGASCLILKGIFK